MKVTVRHSAEMASLRQHARKRVKDIVKIFPQYSSATVYRHCKAPIGQDPPIDQRKFNRGRPSKITQQDIRAIVRAIAKLRVSDGSFTAPRVALEAGVAHKVHIRTVRRILNQAGYHYCRSRKKGLLRRADLHARVDFCRKIRRRKLTQNFWENQISIYVDGKGFQFKTMPLDQARAPSAREWRKRCEGLKFGCTAKGSKEGSVNANFMVGISYGKGVVLCHHYKKAITGDKMVNIINNSFPNAFEKSCNPIAKRILQDGCPRQNSRKALKALENIGGIVFKIPARSPDLNPIENFFGIVTKELRKQVLQNNIVRETFDEFVQRVRETMLTFSVDKIDKIIESMDKRVGMVLAQKGCRIKY